MLKVIIERNNIFFSRCGNAENVFVCDNRCLRADNNFITELYVKDVHAKKNLENKKGKDS